MATLSVQKVSADSPIVPTFAAVTLGGDQFLTTGKELLELQNLGSQASTTTVNAQNTCSQGFLHNVSDNIATGIAQTSLGGPFDRTRFGDSSGNVHLSYANATLPAPTAPALSAAGTGGTWAAQTAWVKQTLVNAQGETIASVVSSQAVAANGTLTINSPAAAGSGAGAATGWYAYVGVGAAEPADTAKYRQQAAGSPTAIGTNLTLTANPTTTGATPPASNTATALFAAVVSS